MIQLRPGDLVAVRNNDTYVLLAILTKQILFGGHWSFVFHGIRKALPSPGDEVVGPGFNAVVDFIVPKREERVIRISRGNNFSSHVGPELLQQEPLRGITKNYRIWRWTDSKREDAEFVRATSSRTSEERAAPHYSCIPADWAWELAERRWEVHMTKYDA